MTRDEFEHLIAERWPTEHNNFDAIEPKRSSRRDLHAFLLLDELQPGSEPIVSAAAHDEFWVSVYVDKLCEVITEAQCLELVRCGARYSFDSLGFFT